MAGAAVRTPGKTPGEGGMLRRLSTARRLVCQRPERTDHRPTPVVDRERDGTVALLVVYSGPCQKQAVTIAALLVVYSGLKEVTTARRLWSIEREMGL